MSLGLGEVQQLQWELKKHDHERIILTNEITLLASKVEELEKRLTAHTELQTRYDALLQMYGEKMEECQELKLDLEDVKEMYKIQVGSLPYCLCSMIFRKLHEITFRISDRRIVDSIAIRMTMNFFAYCLPYVFSQSTRLISGYVSSTFTFSLTGDLCTARRNRSFSMLCHRKRTIRGVR